MQPNEHFHEDNLAKEFFDIAGEIAASEANNYLDRRLAQLDRWVIHRGQAGAPADLRSLINQVMQEPNERGPVIVALCTALWRLREMEKANADQ